MEILSVYANRYTSTNANVDLGNKAGVAIDSSVDLDTILLELYIPIYILYLVRLRAGLRFPSTLKVI